MKPGLAHQRQKPHGFQGYGLSAGVGAGDDQQMKFLSQMDIDGNYPVFVDQRVAALADGLFYLARIYQNYIKKMDLNIYSSGQIPLPVPVYVVFYNGGKAEDEYQELKLSDAFMKSEFTGQAALECNVMVININLGHNEELLENCKILWEYAYFVNEVRENQKHGFSIEEAVRKAQKNCIEQDILKEFLKKNSAEVKDVILEEFNQEKYEEGIREEERQKGRIEGRQEGQKETLINLYRKHLLTLEQAAEEYGTTVEEFQKLL